MRWELEKFNKDEEIPDQAAAVVGTKVSRLATLELAAAPQGSQTHWRGLFAERFGDITDLQVAAAKLAG